VKKAAAPKRARVVDRATKYARDVVAGRIVAGPHVRAQCRRHLADLKNGEKRGLVWRIDQAQRVIDFFEQVLVLEGARPFLLQPWQAFIVGSLFGWYRQEGPNADQTRRFRAAYMETAKGNGKSPLAAGIGLTGLAIDGEPAAEIYSAAVTRDQASIVFRDAKRMVDESPDLSDLILNEAHTLSIGATHSVMRAVSSEHRGLDGKRVHIALIDELHEHPNSLVVDKMRLGQKGRQNPLIFMITNAGYDRNSVCWREHEYAVQVAHGAVENDAYFSYVCALDEGDDYRDPKVWVKTNPNLGVSVHPRYLQELIEEASGMPAKLNLILRLNFCVWTESHTVWISAEAWNRNAGGVDVAAIAKRNTGRPVYIGLDLASVSDLAAAALAFPVEDDPEAYDVLIRCWLCEDAFTRRAKMGREPYEMWRDQGFITVTPGGATDYDTIERDIIADAKRYDVREIVYDRYWASQLVAHLQDNLGEERVIQFGQGFVSMNAPTKEVERLAARTKFRHGGNPLLAWTISNVAIAQDPAGNQKPDKARSAEKIDPAVALVMAIGRAMVRNAAPPPPPKSVYESRGLLVL